MYKRQSKILYWNKLAICQILLLDNVFFQICQCLAQDQCFEVTKDGLKHAICRSKQLTSIPDNLDRGTKVLEFNDNQLTYLGMNQFENYLQLQEILLARNKIADVAPDAFADLYNVQILDLESNELTEIPKTALRHLASVRILNFEGNPIRIIEEDSFSGLNKIESINLENCNIKSIDPFAFSNLPALKDLNLANNELSHLSSEMQPVTTRLEILHINNNPWHCDCDLRWLRRRLQDKDINWIMRQREPTCSSPGLLHTVGWTTLHPDQFACAAIIDSSTNTSLQLHLNTDMNIECITGGDPVPQVTWMKGSRYITENYTPFMKTEPRKYKSLLHLINVQPNDVGDYKCIANNTAGRSEVTFKLWAEAPPPAGSRSKDQLTVKLLLAIIIPCVLLAIVVFCIIPLLLVLYRRRKNGQNGQRTVSINNKSCLSNTTANQQTDQNNISKSSVATVNKDPFKMKIFVPYESDHQQHPSDDETMQMNYSSEAQPLSPPSEPCQQSEAQLDTPDILLDRSQVDTAALAFSGPRAPENPYTKPPILKTKPVQTKSSSADDLLEDIRSSPKREPKRSSSRDDLQNIHTSGTKPERRTRFKDPIEPYNPRDSKTMCTNPVCLKDHTSHNRQQKAGLLESPRTLRHKRTATDSPPTGWHYGLPSSTPHSEAYINKYRTLPARQRSHPETSEPPRRLLPATPTQKPANSQSPAVAPKSVSFNDDGHPVIDLTQETPDSLNTRLAAPQDEWYRTLPSAFTQAKQTESPGTTVEQLLSPPFGKGSQTLKPKKRVPKPGETDEFGTAV